jgi:type II secretory pathway pseudopilin PulG
LEVSKVHQIRSDNQAGFSIFETLIAITVMILVTAGVASLMRDSMMIANTTYELTDAQESLRTAHEYISRDLMNAGDGLKSISYLPVNTTFVQNYLTRTPITDGTMPTLATNLGILTTDNNLPSSWTTPGPLPSPSPSPIASPTPVDLLAGTDRQTILEIDPDLASNPQIAPASISSAGDVVTLASTTTTADMAKFTPGEIYFFTSSRGGTFGALTSVDAANKKLNFASGDRCGFNTTANNRIKDISGGGSLTTTMQRMKIIHYFIDANKLLKRRVFGEQGAAFRDTIVAEHVLGVQFIYSLGLDGGGNPLQPTDLISTPIQQVNISAVQVTVTVETPHVNQKGVRPPPISSTSTTSLRNMQFRQALQPTATSTP